MSKRWLFIWSMSHTVMTRRPGLLARPDNLLLCRHDCWRPDPRVLAGSGDFKQLVAEVGYELEGAAEGGNVAVQDVLGGDVAAFDVGAACGALAACDRGDACAGAPNPVASRLLGHPAPLAHLAQPPAAGVIQHRG